MSKSKTRINVKFDELPEDVQISVIKTLRESDDMADYLLFVGKHVSGLTLIELGERFNLSSERIRQKLEGIYAKVRTAYAEHMKYDEDASYVVSAIGEESCRNIAGIRATIIRER